MPTILETPVDPVELNKSFAFHATLNPKLWDKDHLDLSVHVALLKAAYEFVRFLAVPELKVVDVIFTGSNAAYNYTDYSDLDVHIIVDFEETMCPALAENFFNTKKTLWNQSHHVTVRGYGLEMYVEDTKNPVTANGVFSLLQKRWLHHPIAQAPKWDDSSVLAKVESIADEIEALLLAQAGKEDIDRMFDRIRRMRRAGLARGGELSTENLAFKGLRNLGVLDKLYRARQDAEDRELSLESSGNSTP